MSSYLNRYVTFLDILGFREIVEDENCDVDSIAGLLNVYSDISQPPRDEDGNELFHHTIFFSDSVVRISTEFSDKYPGAAERGELVDLGIIQREIMKKGYLVRGGLTFERIYFERSNKMDNTIDIAFGPGFNRAYDLERKYAKSPRIIIDPKFFEKKESLGPGIGDIVCKDKDGCWHVDYLRSMFQPNVINSKDVYIPDADIREFFKYHKQFIVKGLGGKKDINIRLKYLWLAEYHNSTVDKLTPEKLGNLGQTREDLLIRV